MIIIITPNWLIEQYRLADDFCIYFDEEEEFSDVSRIIAKILNKYKLSINKEKYLQNFSQDKELIWMLNIVNISNYFDNDAKELDITNSYITLDNKKYEFQDENFPDSLIKKIVEEIGKINEDKNLTNFYKIILKRVNYPLIIKQFVENLDSQLIKTFLDVIVHYINLNELQINIPFILVKNFLIIMHQNLKSTGLYMLEQNSWLSYLEFIKKLNQKLKKYLFMIF